MYMHPLCAQWQILKQNLTRTTPEDAPSVIISSVLDALLSRKPSVLELEEEVGVTFGHMISLR